MIKGIIFDLGHTLIRLNRDFNEVAREGAEMMAEWYVKKKRIKLDEEALIEAFLAERQRAWLQSNETHTEILTRGCLERALDKSEAPVKAKTSVLLDMAVKIYFEPAEKAWQAYPDAVLTLRQLKAQPYHLGMYSNAPDDFSVQRLVNVNRLRPELTATLSSAAFGWRKPKPDGFQLIAKRWGLAPDEVVVVGDTLAADILGAQNAGMKSILVTMDEAQSNDDHRHIEPTAQATQLADLPEIIARL